MKVLKKIAIGIIFVVVAVVASGYLLPNSWSVERFVIIKASPLRVYPLISDMKNGWPQWSAFDFEDPNIQYTYSGPEVGLGSTREWKSKKMGNGKQTIIKSDLNYGIEFKLYMPENNFELQGKIGFVATAEGTKVTWADWGQSGSNPFKRWMFFFMDRMMGKTFEKSLAKLKELAEDPAK